ncbi:MAG TPA: hypothetical protein VFS40_16070 [Gemmatimonadales bacterium]|nr:hypothetical protein [Gemmatimonadales bacterium]
MPWRTLEHEGTTWSVSRAAERRGGAASWSLVLGFRPAAAPAGTSSSGSTGAAAAGPRPRALWVVYPAQSGSQAALFTQAERIGADELRSLLLAALAEASRP